MKDKSTANKFKKSQSIFKICIESKDIEEILIPEKMREEAAIASCSSYWISRDSLIILGLRDNI